MDTKTARVTLNQMKQLKEGYRHALQPHTYKKLQQNTGKSNKIIYKPK